MKILHTADWHLGQFFLNRNREEEHEMVLNQIIEIIKEQEIDILLLAGDVFDTGSPSVASQRLYYDFWKKLRNTPCVHAVVVGGNHDSPSVLNAPKEVLQLLDIQVVGSAERLPNGEIDFEKEVLLLKNSKNEVQAVVCAVPYLRDRDLKSSGIAETTAQRQDAIVKGIKNHYAQIAEIAQKYAHLEIPILATGHLFAAGLDIEKQEGELDIHMGNLGKVGSDCFAEIFSYVALGHIHKPQTVGKQNRIRYSGSPLPLSFSERTDRKIVLILEYEKGILKNITEKNIDVPRKLKRWEGTLEEISLALETYDNSLDFLPCWAEIIIKTDQTIFDLDSRLKTIIGSKKIEILKLVTQQKNKVQTLNMPEIDLEYLNPEDVFEQRISEVAPEEQAELLLTFQELYTLWQEENG